MCTHECLQLNYLISYILVRIFLLAGLDFLNSKCNWTLEDFCGTRVPTETSTLIPAILLLAPHAFFRQSAQVKTQKSLGKVLHGFARIYQLL